MTVKEFWEWYGLKLELLEDEFSGVPDFERGEVWVDQDGEIFEDMPITPDNLFGYAVPALQEKGYQIDIVCYEHKGFNVGIFSVLGDGSDLVEQKGNVLKDVLYKAICGVIEK